MSSHGHDSAHHVVPVRVYVLTFAALLVLTAITVAASYVDFGGSLNIVVAMLIATVKVSLVMLFFMGLKYDRPLNSVIILSGFVFLFIFFMLTFVDTGFRAEIDPERGARIEDLYKAK
ncbi:MAG: cytochrome C oxidase subunit IV family protein [Planctomycetota bacterium]